MTDNGEYTTATQTEQPPAAPPVPPTTTAAPPGPGPSGGRGGGGATIGIVLILVGAALLFARFVPVFSIWQLWPLFVIVPGLVQCFTPGREGWSAHRFFDGLVTVTIGVVLLGNSTGYVSWGVWWQIVQLWPVLLISAGLGLLGKAVGQNWLRVLGTIVVIAALLLATASSFSSAPVRLFATAGGEEFVYDEPLGSVTDGSFVLKSGVGEITVDSQRSRNVTVEGSSPFGEPVFEVGRSGGSAQVEFSLTGGQNISVSPGTPSTRVDAELPEQIPWDISIDSGVSNLDADLSGLEVTELRVKTGVSSNTIRLGDAPESVEEGIVSIDSGVSSVKLLVPRDAEVRVESNSGLTGFDISQLLTKQDNRTWETPGYDDAREAGRPVWTITAKSGLGSFAVDSY